MTRWLLPLLVFIVLFIPRPAAAMVAVERSGRAGSPLLYTALPQAVEAASQAKGTVHTAAPVAGLRANAVAVSPTAARILTLVNAARARAGLLPLRVSVTLMNIAQRYSSVEAAQGYISHTGPDGSSPGDRLDRGGYNWRVFGENLAAGQQSADDVVTAWLNSPGHRANILNWKVSEIGLGVTHRTGDPSGFGYYWTMELGTRQ